MFMCVFSTFRSSDFLLFVKNGFVVGVRTLNVTAGHWKNAVCSYDYPHCASATRRLALDNRTYTAQLANATRFRPTLSWIGGAVAEWVRAEGGRGGREGGREGEDGREGGREGGRVDEWNERGRDGTRYGRREG